MWNSFPFFFSPPRGGGRGGANPHPEQGSLRRPWKGQGASKGRAAVASQVKLLLPKFHRAGKLLIKRPGMARCQLFFSAS